MFKYEITTKLRGVEEGLGGSWGVLGSRGESRRVMGSHGGFRPLDQGFSHMRSTIFTLQEQIAEFMRSQCNRGSSRLLQTS